MENSVIANKRSVKNNEELKRNAKKTKKYYGEGLFENNPNATKTKIRKLFDLEAVSLAGTDEASVVGGNAPKLTKDELVAMVRKVGLTGRSGNGFSVAEKLENYKANRGILLINGVECDPGLVTDSWIYRNKKQEIRYAARVLDNTFGFDEIVLATKERIEKINGINQVKVIDRFPMGYENYLVKYALGLELKPTEHPTDKGILVMNLQTVLAIAELTQNVNAGEYKYITIGNLITGIGKVARVRLGDKVSDVAAKYIDKRDLSKHRLYIGSGAMNCHLSEKDEVIDNKTCFIAVGEMPDYNSATKCKGCGACVKNCPQKVDIKTLVRTVDSAGVEGLNAIGNCNVNACIGCGACTFGCMAGKDIRGLVAWKKAKVS